MATRGRPRKTGPPKTEQVEQSLSDILSNFGSAISTQARTPNLLGYTPHDKQVEFHSAQIRRRLYIGGNRSGKTTGGVIEDLWWLTHRHPYRNIPNIPIHGRALSADNDTMIKVFFDKFKQYAVPSDLLGGSWSSAYSAREKTLYFENGSTLEFKTYEQDVLAMAGTSRHFIHFDEPPPKFLYGENILRLLDRYDDFPLSGSWWMTYTPIHGMDWTYDDIYKPALDAAPGEAKVKIIHASIYDNPYISREAIDEAMAEVPEEEREARLNGNYVQLGGNIFKEFSPAHVLNDFDIHSLWGPSLLPPSNWQLYWSMDHGLNAPTAIYWHAVSPDGSIITFHEHYQSEMIVADHAKVVHDYEKNVLKGREPWIRIGDPAIKQRNGQTGMSIQAVYAQEGIYISTELQSDRMTGIVRMRQHMRINPATGRPYWQIYDAPHLVSELQRIHWKTYTSLKERDRNNPIEEVHKKDDHGFDSCKYLFTLMPDLTPDPPPADYYQRFPPGSLIHTINQPATRSPGPADEWQVESIPDYDPLGLEDPY